jgi:hypothetical protein
MKKTLIDFGRIFLSIILGVVLSITHYATSNSIEWNLFFTLLFIWGIYRLLWGTTKSKPKRKRFKIDSKAWKEDFGAILAEEGFNEAQAKKAIKFTDTFRGFERTKFKIAQDRGFKGQIEEYDSGWEKVFCDIMDVGTIALEMRPKTLGFLESFRNSSI